MNICRYCIPNLSLSFTLIPVSQKPFPHRIEQTKNKHSRAVFREETIVIRLARNLSEQDQKKHVEDLLSRMTKQLIQEEVQRVRIHPFKALLEGREEETITLANGTTYTFCLHPGKRLASRRTKEGWRVSVSQQTRCPQLHRFLWKLLSDAEQERTAAWVGAVNQETFQVRIQHVRLRFASSQWGSCSSREVIMLNTALLFLPPHLLRYVAIHELAHRLCPNHSAAYWKRVEKVLPHYKQARSELHSYRLPTA
ncbi:hypothetical protein COU76_03170 [Candidatus Peregrinibacteria bacterium CG10_big_fil_rev_8_21_14_0_10_49_10]|nr:MAG: hypothetical protein COU76_03170 [Candidatus Peregrinibacteria bacterium CG10_big_fil_rev_8_21_14_0_10_49_10]